MLKELDHKLDYFRDLIKKEIIRACSASYADYKAEKKISLDDNNIDVGKNTLADDTKDLTIETKNKNNNQSADKNFKYAMPYAQDATRR